ncbi:MAG TPA: hypothetical protein PLU80_15340, partial [Acidobacteriota bacterium]|nr:hypothetical protein [Acidobacteriota bacterium]
MDISTFGHGGVFITKSLGLRAWGLGKSKFFRYLAFSQPEMTNLKWYEKFQNEKTHRLMQVGLTGFGFLTQKEWWMQSSPQVAKQYLQPL